MDLLQTSNNSQITIALVQVIFLCDIDIIIIVYSNSNQLLWWMSFYIFSNWLYDLYPRGLIVFKKAFNNNPDSVLLY